MKPIVKQKLSSLQDIINNAQSGGSGSDSYTKAEADSKFETITDAASTYLSKSDAASTYLSKSDAANMVNKISVSGTIYDDDLQFTFSVADINLLDNSMIIVKLMSEGLSPIIPLMLYLFVVNGHVEMYSIDGNFVDYAIFDNQTLTFFLSLSSYNAVSGDATLIY